MEIEEEMKQRMSTRSWAEMNDYNSTKLFHKVSCYIYLLYWYWNLDFPVILHRYSISSNNGKIMANKTTTNSFIIRFITRNQ